MVWNRSGGRDDGPLLVLVHGLGGTAEVWRGVEELLPSAWGGGWLAVDLPGHGRSPRAAAYTAEAHAEALAPLLPGDRDVVLLGHSLGGMVALSLAAQAERAGRVSRVVAFAVKSWWPPEHVEGMRRQADREVRTWPRREDALGAYAKVSGLHGLVPADSPALAAGVVGTDGAWQLAQDPATFDFGTPDVPGTVAAATAGGVPVTFARGSEDPFVRAADLAALVPDPVTLPGLGHNPHVEDPAAVVALLG